MFSHWDHVTELKSNISNKTISFQMTVDGKPVNTGRFRIKSLQGPGLVNVNLHDAMDCLRSMRELEIRVLINGEPELILLPVSLFMCARITLDYCVGDGITTLSAKGLDEQKGDWLLRIRFLKKRRQQIYGKREDVPEYVSCIGKAVLEVGKTELTRDNKTCEAVAAPAGDCCIKCNELISELDNGLQENQAKMSSTISPSSLCGSSSDLLEEIHDGKPFPEPANPHTTALSLTYKKPSVMEGFGKVAALTSGTNLNMIQKFSNCLIGFLCENEIPGGTSICECLTETLREFGQFEIKLLSDGFFAIFFTCDKSKTEVLEHRQLFINDQPLILKKWTKHLVYSEFWDSVPVWVRLYNLNWAYWSPEYLSSISSMIGVPLYTDTCTANIIGDPQSIFKCTSRSGRRLDIARVCVEIDPDKVLPSVVNILVNDKLIEIRLEYEWRPLRCKYCSSLCHNYISCNRTGENLELPEQVPGNTWTPPRSSDEDENIPPLETDDDEYDAGVVDTASQSPLLMTGETQDDVETPTSPHEVGATSLKKLLKLISGILHSKKHPLSRAISL